MKALSAILLLLGCLTAHGQGLWFSQNTASVATTYTVTGAGSNGTTTCSSPVASGATTTCTLTPNTGYIGYSVSTDHCNGSLVGATYTTGAVTQNCIVTATYNQVFLSSGTHQALSATASTLTKSISSGHVAACFTSENANGTGTVTFSDSTAGSNTWTQSASGYVSYSTFITSAFFYSKLASGVTTITATWAGGLSTNVNLTCYDLNNMASSSIEDGTSVKNSATTNTTSTSAVFSTSNANDILMFCSNLDNGSTSGWAATAPFTLPSGGSGGRDVCSYEIVQATQSGIHAYQTWTTGAPFANILIGLKTAP